MEIEQFDLERIQSLWENRVKYNLTESGIHPYILPKQGARCLIIPGDHFGLDHYIRLGIESKKSYLLAGLNLIDKMIQQISHEF